MSPRALPMTGVISALSVNHRVGLSFENLILKIRSRVNDRRSLWGKLLSTFSTSGHLSVHCMLYSQCSNPNWALITHIKNLPCYHCTLSPQCGAIDVYRHRPVHAPPIIFLFLARTHTSRTWKFQALFESDCISENIADFRPVLSFLFHSNSIFHVIDCFVCTFVTGKEKRRNLHSIFDRIFVRLHSP